MKFLKILRSLRSAIEIFRFVEQSRASAYDVRRSRFQALRAQKGNNKIKKKRTRGLTTAGPSRFESRSINGPNTERDFATLAIIAGSKSNCARFDYAVRYLRTRVSFTSSSRRTGRRPLKNLANEKVPNNDVSLMG